MSLAWRGCMANCALRNFARRKSNINTGEVINNHMCAICEYWWVIFVLGVSVDWQSGWVYWQGKQEKWNRLTIYNMKSAVTSEWSTLQLLPIARLCPISPDLVAPPCPWPHSCPLARLLISIHTDCCRLTTHLPYSCVTLCQWQSWYDHCHQRRGEVRAQVITL